MTLATLLGSLYCAPALTSDPPFVRQRTPIDCAIAALAMAAGTSYEAADLARRYNGVDLTDYGGTPLPAILAIGHTLGVELHRAPLRAPLTDEGILIVPVETGYHAVWLQKGQVYDPGAVHPVAWALRFPTWDDDALAYVFLARQPHPTGHD